MRYIRNRGEGGIDEIYQKRGRGWHIRDVSGTGERVAQTRYSISGTGERVAQTKYSISETGERVA